MKSFTVVHGVASRIVHCAIVILACCAATRSWAGEAAAALKDTKLYFTAPLRWDGEDWIYFGSAVAAVSIAHRYDDDVRTHFIATNPNLSSDTRTHSLADAAPAAAALVGTWAYATILDDRDGRSESWRMLEATALSATTGLVLKFAAGRERPSATSDSNSWRAGGDAFPSLHATASFAIGTVLAESGNDEYRWVRRVLGYGLGVVTSYQRIRHNQHWLSDTVAGAALGMSSARFVLNRRDARQTQTNLTVMPTDGGVLLAYSVALH